MLSGKLNYMKKSFLLLLLLFAFKADPVCSGEKPKHRTGKDGSSQSCAAKESGSRRLDRERTSPMSDEPAQKSPSEPGLPSESSSAPERGDLASDGSGASQTAPGSAKPLQGAVEDQQVLPERQAMPKAVEPLPTPVLPASKRQSGHLQENNLSGQINDSPLKPLAPALAPESPVLKGSASLESGKLGAEDPDSDDQELQIEWDRWRNRFLRAVQLGVQENVNNPEPEEYVRPRVDPSTGYIMPRFPMGTSAWFSCQITSDRRIKNLSLIKSSGFSTYDAAVLRAVRALEGTSLLRYPSGSHRLTVTQEAGIKTAESAEFRYYKFGDVERYRTPQP